MSGNSTGDVELEPLPYSEIVYRALLRRQWINEDTRMVKADAYLLREKEKNTGLSVNIARTCSAEQCAKGFHKCFGVASLQVGYIRDIGLDVVPDSPTHANIIGLPYNEDDRDGAEKFAGLLAKRSRIVWTP